MCHSETQMASDKMVAFWGFCEWFFVLQLLSFISSRNCHFLMTGWTVEIACQKPFYIFIFFFIAFLILAAIKSIDFQSLSQQSPCLLSITAKFEESDDFFKHWKCPQPATLNDNFCTTVTFITCS